MLNIIFGYSPSGNFRIQSQRADIICFKLVKESEKASDTEAGPSADRKDERIKRRPKP